MQTLWGIDLGGTKIEGVILLVGSTTPIARKRIDTEAAQGYDHIIDRIALLIELLQQESGLEAPQTIGIGTPGAAEPGTGLMKNCNTTALNGRPLTADLEGKLNRRVRLENDANCFALAEATLGAAKGYQTVFGIIMGTGVGGGIVINGQVLTGQHGIAGEWGHNLLDPDGDLCYCGKIGCVETVLAGPSLERDYRRRSGKSLKLKEIVQMAEQEDEHAMATLSNLHQKFGLALAQVVNVLDPQAIVLGGGVGNIASLYTEGKAELAKNIFNPTLTTPLLRPTLGDSAGVFGAAMLSGASRGSW